MSALVNPNNTTNETKQLIVNFYNEEEEPFFYKDRYFLSTAHPTAELTEAGAAKTPVFKGAEYQKEIVMKKISDEYYQTKDEIDKTFSDYVECIGSIVKCFKLKQEAAMLLEAEKDVRKIQKDWPDHLLKMDDLPLLPALPMVDQLVIALRTKTSDPCNTSERAEQILKLREYDSMFGNREIVHQNRIYDIGMASKVKLCPRILFSLYNSKTIDIPGKATAFGPAKSKKITKYAPVIFMERFEEFDDQHMESVAIQKKSARFLLWFMAKAGYAHGNPLLELMMMKNDREAIITDFGHVEPLIENERDVATKLWDKYVTVEDNKFICKQEISAADEAALKQIVSFCITGKDKIGWLTTEPFEVSAIHFESSSAAAIKLPRGKMGFAVGGRVRKSKKGRRKSIKLRKRKTKNIRKQSRRR